VPGAPAAGPEAVAVIAPPPAHAADASPRAAPDRRAIAVLPFENLSAGTEGEYFGDGISEEIINALAQLPELRVAGRTSAFSFKGRHEDLRQIGRALNVGTVLEGSIRLSGDRVRITAQLIDTADGYHLWSERFDRDLHDIFQVQDEIARGIASKLAVKLGTRGPRPLVARHPDDPEAYALFLQGRHHLAALTGDGFDRAAAALEAAIEKVPDYAMAYTSLAECRIVRGLLLDEPYARSAAQGHAAALRALELDDGIAEAHAALGGVLTFYELDWDGAERQLLRALELSSGSSWPRMWYADLLCWVGRYEEAIAQARAARDADPLAPLARWGLIQNLWAAGRLDESEAEARRTLQFLPDAYFPHQFLGLCAWSRGDSATAILKLEETVAALPSPFHLAVLGAVHYEQGSRERADELLDAMRHRALEEHASAGAFFILHLVRGEVDDAIRCLRTARANRDAICCQLKALVRAAPLEVPPEVDAEFQRLGFR
jgi:TolB-like protein/tetratricopeptide (TPR) repeat protein